MEKYQNDSQAIGLAIARQKKQERQRKKKGAKKFTRKPYRMLNENKKRRTSTQKADNIMESMDEQALMADKVLNDCEDAIMQEDEIGYDKADTTLVEDGDQGSDYNIDEYLDAKCKLFIIFIQIH
jgi:hypothetical protein